MAYSSKKHLMSVEERAEIVEILEKMVSDNSFNTTDTYSPNIELYPNNRMSFVDKHMSYLRSNPNTDLREYLSNLRLMTRVHKTQ